MKLHPANPAWVWALLWALAAPIRAQESRGLETSLAEADSLVAAWVGGERIPGAVLLITKNGRVVLERAYGWAQLYAYGNGEYGASAAGEVRPTALRRLANPIAMTTSTVFDVASVTKVMATTFAVMLLTDRGALELDAPVHTYLPGFRGGEKDAITLRHLLTHRAGLLQWVPTYYHAADADEAYAHIRDLPLGWPVGEGRHYSDLSFMLLGRVVEQVAEVSLDTFLRRDLYGPVGLGATGFRPRGAAPPATEGVFAATSHGNPYEHRMVHDSTFGYVIAGDPDAWDGWRHHTLVGEVNDGNSFHGFGGVAGHAGLFSTASELGVLLRLLLSRGEMEGQEHIRSETVETFLTSTGGGQALGWQVPDYAPPGSFVHTGFTGAYVLGVPRDSLGIVLLTNRQNGGLEPGGHYPDLGPLQRGVAAAILGGGR